ncbi:MAG: pitrilysin family protein [Rhodovibrionaceae bacterium]
MSVQVTRLDNGLTVATDRMDSVETVSLGAWVGIGARHEAPPVNGIAHFLEHMAFKGTVRRSARQIAEEIEAVGGHLNAYTSRETTAFYAKVLTEDAPLALDIVSDILLNSTFAPQEVERERSVILQEIGQAQDTPDDIIFDHFQETAFPGQAVGRPVLGRAETVGSFSREDLRGYLAGNYTAGSTVLAAAGRIDHEDFVARVAEAFSAMGGAGSIEPEPGAYRGGEFREARALEQLHLILGYEGAGFQDPDYYAYSVFSTLLGGGMSSRLFQEVREERGLVYTIFSFNGAHCDGGLFGIYAGSAPEDAAEVLPVVQGEIETLAAEPVGEEELARARQQLKAGLLMSRERSSSRVEQLANQLLIYGAPRSVESLVAAVDAVDAAAIQRVAGRLLEGPRTLAGLGPASGLQGLDGAAKLLA